MFCFYTALYNQNISSNFPVFHKSRCIFLRSEAFLLLIFVSTTLSFSWANCHSWRLIIFLIDLSVISGTFPSRFLKCSFHYCSFSSWLAAFCLAFKVLFLPLVYLLPIFWLYWFGRECRLVQFFLVCVSYLWDFRSFCTLAFVGFFLLSKDAFSFYFVFFSFSSLLGCFAFSCCCYKDLVWLGFMAYQSL